ncbi:MAG: hypothetical protein ACI8RD_009962 [Bacillariaceae sp.]|jgi:hypothetical protein
MPARTRGQSMPSTREEEMGAIANGRSIVGPWTRRPPPKMGSTQSPPPPSKASKKVLLHWLILLIRRRI